MNLILLIFLPYLYFLYYSGHHPCLWFDTCKFAYYGVFPHFLIKIFVWGGFLSPLPAMENVSSHSECFSVFFSSFRNSQCISTAINYPQMLAIFGLALSRSRGQLNLQIEK